MIAIHCGQVQAVDLGHKRGRRYFNDSSFLSMWAVPSILIFWISSIYSRIMKRNLNKCNLVVRDNTGAMVISLLEENINKVSVDNSYCFHLVTAKSLYRKQLNSSRASMISKSDNVVISDKLSDIARGLVANDVSSESVVGRILAISIKEVVHLHKCTSKIVHIPGQSVF